MADHDLHLFINDDEILARKNLHRMVHTLRRESVAPVIAPDGEDEGSAIHGTSVVQDPETGKLKMWYAPTATRQLCLAVSDDGMQWTRHGRACDPELNFVVDNVWSAAPVGPDVDPWFAGAKLVGTACIAAGLGGDNPVGIYALRSMDGEHWEVKLPCILPGRGDRSGLYFDGATGEYLFTTRAYYGYSPGFTPVEGEEVIKHRIIRLYRSRNLIDWQDFGIVFRFDDNDPPDAQIYGLQPFRCGAGFLAFVEVHHQDIERLDTQLAWSSDGVRWQRVGQREAVLPLGGEGSWDSHWVQVIPTPPIPDGNRLRVFYSGADTKHASGLHHRRAIGLATMGRDRWVSLEAGKVEGQVVTGALPLTRPMKLELNANVTSGHISVDIIPGDEYDYAFTPLPEYPADASLVEHMDSIQHRVAWGDEDIVKPIEGGKCFLRFTMRQGSLFTYRWSEA